MQPRKRILILENAIDVTGGLKSILNSSNELSADFEFIIVLPKKNNCITYAHNRGFGVVTLPFKELNKSVLSFLIYLPALLINTIRLTRLVKKLNISLIISNDFYNLLPCSYRFFGGSIPYICYVRFMPNRFPTLLVRIWESCHKKFASNVIAVSNAVKNNLTIAGAVVVYEGLPKPYKTLLAPAAAPKMNTRTLLYLSNYIDGKGHEFALLSFEKLADRYPFWKLRFVGGDMGTKKNQTYKEYLVNKAIEMNLHDQVEWIGFCEDVSKEYHVADVVLNFSNSESFSLTCLEAMSAGRPVISTDSGGPAEIIKHNESGILVPVGDVQAMHEAMDLLMSNPQLRETMGNKAFYQVRDKFNFDETISKLKTIYLKALGS